MDVVGPQSLFVVVCYERNPTQYGILRFELLDTPEQIKWTKEIVRINQRPEIQWLLSPPTSCDDNLYMVPHLRYVPGKTKPFYGYKFNFRTGEFGPFNSPPMPSKSFGHVVNLRGKIYFMAHEWHYEKQSVFQCYNPMENSWSTLAPFPNSSSCLGPIVGTAVWGDDTILFNVGSRCIWAYVVSEDKWYAVGFDHSWCVSIEGEAVLIKDTIYALSNCSFGSVLALSIVKGGIVGGLVFNCSLISVFRVPNLVPILYGEEAWMRTRHLVHLGEDNFCVVQSCGLLGYNDSQPIELTYIKLMGESSKTDVKIGGSMTVCHDMKIENSKIVRYDVKIKSSVTFIVQLCFTLPQDRTTGLKQGKRLVFNFNPFDDASKPVQEQGHLIYVRKLPPNTTVGQVEQAFKVFGPIKKDGIQIEKTREGMSFASVNFESAFSKHRAVKVSTVLIGDHEVEISEKSLTGKKPNRGKARVGWNGTSRVDSQGEVSRSKMTCGGGNGGEGPSAAGMAEIEDVDDNEATNPKNGHPDHPIVSYTFDSEFIESSKHLESENGDKIVDVYSHPKGQVAVFPAELEQRHGESDNDYIKRLKPFVEKQCLEIQELLSRNATLVEEMSRIGGNGSSQLEHRPSTGYRVWEKEQKESFREMQSLL